MASIRTRVHSLLFMTMGVIAVEGWYGIQGLNETQERIQRTSEHLIPLSRVISRLETMQTQQHNQFAKALPDEEASNQIQINPRIVHDQINRLMHELDRGMEIIQEIRDDQDSWLDPREVDKIREHFQIVRNQQQKLDSQINQAMTIKEGGNARLSLATNRMLIDQTESLEIEIDDLLEAVQDLLASTVTDISSVREKAGWRLAGVMLLSLLAGLLLAWHTTRGILRPLAKANRIAEQISRGELEISIPPPRGAADDELTQLLVSLSTMAGELQKHRRNENRLLQSEKISSLGRLAIGLAHEINNPLANAAMHLEMLRLTLGSCHEGFLERVTSIERNVDKAMTIAKDLLNFSRPEPPAFSRLHIHDSLECVLSLLEHRLTRIRVERHFAP